MSSVAETARRQRTAPRFRLDLPEPQSRVDAMYPIHKYRHPWNHEGLLQIFPEEGVRVLDIGAGHNPLRVRGQDELVTVDFEAETGPSVSSNVATDWPFGE